jgi:hypothetical protein
MTHLGPFERVDQTAFADVGEANDADGGARFVQLEEAEKCWGHARCQVRTLMRTRRAEWEGLSCVAEVFKPGCLGRSCAAGQVYVTIIRSVEYR